MPADLALQLVKNPTAEQVIEEVRRINRHALAHVLKFTDEVRDDHHAIRERWKIVSQLISANLTTRVRTLLLLCCGSGWTMAWRT